LYFSLQELKNYESGENFMKHMKISVIIMAAITAVLMILTIISPSSTDSKSLFANWFMVIILGVFCVVQLVCVFTGKFSAKRLGFYLLHIGLVLFLVGSFMYFVSGEKIPVHMTVQKDQTYSTIQRSDDSKVNLGFDIGITDFKFEQYPDRSPKFYNAKVVIYREGSNTPITKDLYVNGPITENGYKIYLMSYSSQTGDISLMFKTNIGEWPCIIAIWCILIGVFFTCFSKKRERGAKS
jgi:predicted membrane channel-forming protein YqfA (hemolysin III family)